MITSRPATAADLDAFFDRQPDVTIRATVWEREGEILAIAGHYRMGGVLVVFSDIKPNAPKAAIWRASKAFMSRLRSPAICITTKRSAPYLERLGWHYVRDDENGEIYAWQP